MSRYPLRTLALALLLTAPIVPAAQQAPAGAPRETSASSDMIDRVFAAREFSQRPVPPPRWLEDGTSYVVMEPPAAGASSGMNVVQYDAAPGANREVLLTPAQLTPDG